MFRRDTISTHPTPSHHARRPSAFSAALALALLAPWIDLGAPRPAAAETIFVTTTADEVATDGDCALREAIIAANTNAAVDGCAAGSNDLPDVIVLLGGSVYGLTLADPFAGSPAAGDLNVAANAASPDLVILSAGVGRATIQQQTSTTIMSLDAGAALVLDGLELTGGRAAGGGGAIFVPSGNLEVHDCVFADNASLNGSGILLNSATATALVTDSTFVDQSAGGTGNGGAIHSKGRLTVVGSRFAHNFASVAGGAIFVNANVADALQVVDSCFVDNTDGNDQAVASAQAFSQGANGNWWSSSDGPAGSGAGHGEPIGPNVDASAPLGRPSAHCLPWQLARNSRFDRLGNFLLLDPDGWKPSASMTAPASTGCGNNGCFYRIVGNGQKKTLVQTIRIAGESGDRLTFTARSRAKVVPAGGGKYRVVATVFHVDGSKQVTRVNFATGTHGLEDAVRAVIATEPYDRVRLQIEYGKSTGEAVFTDVGVVLEAP